MNIKLASTELTHLAKTYLHQIIINGEKVVRVYQHIYLDETDIVIDKDDKEKLTEEDAEELEDNIEELLEGSFDHKE